MVTGWSPSCTGQCCRCVLLFSYRLLLILQNALLAVFTPVTGLDRKKDRQTNAFGLSATNLGKLGDTRKLHHHSSLHGLFYQNLAASEAGRVETRLPSTQPCPGCKRFNCWARSWVAKHGVRVWFSFMPIASNERERAVRQGPTQESAIKPKAQPKGATHPRAATGPVILHLVTTRYIT